MKIWIFNNYNMLPEQGGLNRHYYFAKYLERMGHEPIVFVGSHPHNTSLQLIDGKEKFAIYQKEPFPWVLVKTCNYEGSKIKRAFSMFEYYFNTKKASKHFEKPDAIIGSSAHPLAALLAIRLGNKYGCKKIVEVRDLWPESIVAYGVASKNNPVVKILYQFEKWLYKKADTIIFTMEGGKDYIIEKGWDINHGGPVDLNKVHHINNGVDLEIFDYNKENFAIKDSDLDNPNFLKIIYMGSIRKANNLDLLLDLARQLSMPNVRFLIWGTGDYIQKIQERIEKEKISNVVLKGAVNKKCVPSIICKADFALLNYEMHDIWKYGGSQNKLFEYFASSTPVITNIHMGYDLLNRYRCGIYVDYSNACAAVEKFEKICSMPKEEYDELANNARKAAEDYDFRILTEKLLNVINGVL